MLDLHIIASSGSEAIGRIVSEIYSLIIKMAGHGYQ